VPSEDDSLDRYITSGVAATPRLLPEELAPEGTLRRAS